MARILRLLLGLLAVIVIITFAIANRTPAEVSFAPLPIWMELPVYAVFMIGLVLGVLIGGIGVWFGALRKGREAKRMRRRASALENQLSVVRQQQERAEAQRHAAPRAMTVQGASG